MTRADSSGSCGFLFTVLVTLIVFFFPSANLVIKYYPFIKSAHEYTPNPILILEGPSIRDLGIQNMQLWHAVVMTTAMLTEDVGGAWLCIQVPSPFCAQSSIYRTITVSFTWDLSGRTFASFKRV